MEPASTAEDRARLDAALGLVTVATLVIDDANEVIWRRAYDEALDPGTDVTGSRPLDRIHPEDIPTVMTLVATARADPSSRPVAVARASPASDPDRWGRVELLA